MKLLIRAAALCLVAFAGAASAQLSVLRTFDQSASVVGLGYDSALDRVWVYEDRDANLRSFTGGGAFFSAIPQPGEAANDADLDIAPRAFVLGTREIAAGTLLHVNGETGTADIYAVDKNTGTVLGSLATSFGASHVVGGAYHPGRNTFFLVQDTVPSGIANDSVVAEIDPLTGAVLNTFKIDQQPGATDFTVFFGDIEVNPATGNLFIVSSDELRIAEFTPGGTLVRMLALPAGVSGLSGIAFNDLSPHIAWVSGTSGRVWELSGLPIPEPQTYALLLAGLGLVGFVARRRGTRT